MIAKPIFGKSVNSSVVPPRCYAHLFSAQIRQGTEALKRAGAGQTSLRKCNAVRAPVDYADLKSKFDFGIDHGAPQDPALG